jgi:YHS domain-containing protein
MAESCPVCGTPLSRVKDPLVIQIMGEPYRFCTRECLAIFQQYPDAYTGGKEPEVSPVEELAFP